MYRKIEVISSQKAGNHFYYRRLANFKEGCYSGLVACSTQGEKNLQWEKIDSSSVARSMSWSKRAADSE